MLKPFVQEQTSSADNFTCYRQLMAALQAYLCKTKKRTHKNRYRTHESLTVERSFLRLASARHPSVCVCVLVSATCRTVQCQLVTSVISTCGHLSHSDTLVKQHSATSQHGSHLAQLVCHLLSGPVWPA